VFRLLLMSAEVVHPQRRRDPARPQHRGELRRARLLAALAAQLQHQPLADVSIATVADEAGLGRSAFYFYFRGKHEAVTDLLSDIFVDQVTQVSAVIRAAGDPRDNLSKSLALVVESWRTQRTLFLAMLDARDADQDTRTIWDTWLRRYEDFTADYIDDHRPSPGRDSRDLAHCLISLNERVLERHLRAGGDDTAAAALHASLVRIWTATIFGMDQ
jgi:TetR/AcrR family transcriptional regulator, ethionamide resistance regulator